MKILENLAFNSGTKKGLNFPAVRHPNQQLKSMGSTQYLIKKKKKKKPKRPIKQQQLQQGNLTAQRQQLHAALCISHFALTLNLINHFGIIPN